MLNATPHTVIPAKAGIQQFPPEPLHQDWSMDSRFRGNDERR